MQRSANSLIEMRRTQPFATTQHHANKHHGGRDVKQSRRIQRLEKARGKPLAFFVYTLI
jgi:hypothetical protein